MPWEKKLPEPVLKAKKRRKTGGSPRTAKQNYQYLGISSPSPTKRQRSLYAITRNQVPPAVIFVEKGDHTGSRIKGLNPRSGNRRAVGIPRQIADHMRGRIQGLLQMDMKGETGKQLLEGRLQEEGRIQLRKKDAAEDFGKRLGREEEVLRGMNKGSPRSRQTASGNEYMEMGMKLKRRPPGMKNGGEAGRETEKTLGSG